jgi:hypothetical protein
VSGSPRLKPKPHAPSGGVSSRPGHVEAGALSRRGSKSGLVAGRPRLLPPPSSSKPPLHLSGWRHLLIPVESFGKSPMGVVEKGAIGDGR